MNLLKDAGLNNLAKEIIALMKDCENEERAREILLYIICSVYSHGLKNGEGVK